MSERLASEILKIAREVLAIGQHKKPVKYDHNFLKRLLDLEPKSGVLAIGKPRKKKRQAFEFSTKDELETYLKEHPAADKSLHWVRPSHLSQPPKTPEEAAERKFGKGESYKSLTGEQYRNLMEETKSGFGDTDAGYVARYGLDILAEGKHAGGHADIMRGPEGNIQGVCTTYRRRNGDLELDALASNGEVRGMGTFLIAKTIRHQLKKGRNLRLSAIPEADSFYQHLGMEETGMNDYGGINWQFPYEEAKKFSDFVYDQLFQRGEKPKEAKPKKVLKKVKPAGRSLNPVQSILRQQELSADSDEVQELAGFKKSIMRHQRLSQKQAEHMKAEGSVFWPRNEKKLKEAFLRNMNPANYGSPEAFKNAKDRIQRMPVTDFGKLLAAIMAEDEEVAA